MDILLTKIAITAPALNPGQLRRSPPPHQRAFRQ